MAHDNQSRKSVEIKEVFRISGIGYLFKLQILESMSLKPGDELYTLHLDRCIIRAIHDPYSHYDIPYEHDYSDRLLELTVEVKFDLDKTLSWIDDTFRVGYAMYSRKQVEDILSTLKKTIGIDLLQQARKRQQWEIAAQVVHAYPGALSTVRVIGGMDISYLDGTDIGVACLVTLSYPSLEVLNEFYVIDTMTEPYVPGFLAYRELPLLSKVYNRAIKTLSPHDRPQVLMLDGNGILHPQGAGLASHFGVMHAIPTIGVTKRFKPRGNWTIEDSEDLPWSIPVFRNWQGEVRGAAWHPPSSAKAVNPVYVSIGHLMSLRLAIALVKGCCKHRIPEPTRQADIRGREYIRTKLFKASKIQVPSANLGKLIAVKRGEPLRTPEV